jgi:hypothetical protein
MPDTASVRNWRDDPIDHADGRDPHGEPCQLKKSWGGRSVTCSLARSRDKASTRPSPWRRVSAVPRRAAPVYRSGTFVAGTRRIEGKWLFSDMFGGSSSPLSVDHYYYP